MELSALRPLKMRIAYITLMIVLVGYNARAENAEPFGLATVPAPQNVFSENWLELQNNWIIERGMLDQCRAERENCSSHPALQFLAMIDEARGQTGRAQLGHINRAINLAIRPKSDLANYGVREIWKAPLATLTNGVGDCTDYAIAKYYALGEIGVPAEDRRLVVVNIKTLGVQHAVVAVREGQHWLILDNRHMAIADAADLTQYVPLVEFEHRSVREFVNPSVVRVVRREQVS